MTKQNPRMQCANFHWVTNPHLFSANRGESEGGTNEVPLKQFMDECGTVRTMISTAAIKMGMSNHLASMGFDVHRYVDPVTGVCSTPVIENEDAIETFVDLIFRGLFQAGDSGEDKKDKAKKAKKGEDTEPIKEKFMRRAQFVSAPMRSASASTPTYLLGTRAEVDDAGKKGSNSIHKVQVHGTRMQMPHCSLAVSDANGITEEIYDIVMGAIANLGHCGGAAASYLSDVAPRFMIGRVTQGLCSANFDHRLVTVVPGTNELDISRLLSVLKNGGFRDPNGRPVDPSSIFVSGVDELNEDQVEALKDASVSFHDQPADMIAAMKPLLF